MQTSKPPLIPGSQNYQQLQATKLRTNNIIGSYTDWKQSVVVVATDNVVLTGLTTIDDVELVAGNRVLLTGQDDPIENGIYVVSESRWERSTDMPVGSSATGTLMYVILGDSSNESIYACENNQLTDIVGTNEFYFFKLTGGGGGGGAPGGSVYDVQFNNAEDGFGGSSNFNYNPITQTLACGIADSDINTFTITTHDEVGEGVSNLHISTGDGSSAGNLVISTGDGNSAGNITIKPGEGITPGDITIEGSRIVEGGTRNGDVLIFGSDDGEGGKNGVIRIEGSISINAVGGLALNSSLILPTYGINIPDVATPVIANGTQAFIQIAGVSTAAGATDIITVTTENANIGSMILTNINGYSGTGVPSVCVGSKASGTFTIRLSNSDIEASLSGPMDIVFMIFS